MWRNLVALNRLREKKGLSSLSFRPHSGESGSLNHLAAAYLTGSLLFSSFSLSSFFLTTKNQTTAHGINHGIQLAHSPPLQYLYYLSKIGVNWSDGFFFLFTF